MKNCSAQPCATSIFHEEEFRALFKRCVINAFRKQKTITFEDVCDELRPLFEEALSCAKGSGIRNVSNCYSLIMDNLNTKNARSFAEGLGATIQKNTVLYKNYLRKLDLLIAYANTDPEEENKNILKQQLQDIGVKRLVDIDDMLYVLDPRYSLRQKRSALSTLLDMLTRDAQTVEDLRKKPQESWIVFLSISRLVFERKIVQCKNEMEKAFEKMRGNYEGSWCFWDEFVDMLVSLYMKLDLFKSDDNDEYEYEYEAQPWAKQYKQNVASCIVFYLEALLAFYHGEAFRLEEEEVNSEFLSVVMWQQQGLYIAKLADYLIDFLDNPKYLSAQEKKEKGMIAAAIHNLLNQVMMLDKEELKGDAKRLRKLQRIHRDLGTVIPATSGGGRRRHKLT